MNTAYPWLVDQVVRVSSPGVTNTPHVTIVLPCYNEQDHVIDEGELWATARAPDAVAAAGVTTRTPTSASHRRRATAMSLDIAGISLAWSSARPAPGCAPALPPVVG